MHAMKVPRRGSMKRILLRSAILLISSIATIIGALCLARFVETLQMNMPYAVDMFLRGVLKLSGNDDLANPDDMEVLALTLYFLVALVVVGCAVFAFNIALRRYLTKRRQRA